MFEDGDDKERIALGVLVDKGGEAGRKRVLLQFPAEQLADGGLVQWGKSDFCTELAEEQVVLHSPERMVGRGIAVAAGSDDHEFGGSAAAGESGNEVEGGLVSPVQVFEEEKQRIFRRYFFESGAEIAGHAFGNAGRRGCRFRLASRSGQPGGGKPSEDPPGFL